jgi:AsmA protein
MGKLIKWLLGLTLIIVILLVGAVIVLPMIIDPNDYKDELVAAVEEKTGRAFAVKDDLQLSTFPWLGIETGGVRLGNAAGFGNEPFAQINRLAVRVKVVPLFSRQVEVDTLVLDGLQLNLEKNAQGKTNWEDLQQQASGKKGQHEQPQAGSEEGDATLLGFAIGGIELKNTQIHWQDAQAGQDYKVQDVYVLAGSLLPGGQTPVEAGFKLQSQQPALNMALKLKTELGSSVDLQSFQLHDLSLNTQASGDGLPTNGIELDLTAQVDVDIAEDTLLIRQLQLQGPETDLQGDVTVSNLRQQPQVQGKLQLAETNIKQLARLFGVEIVTQNAQALSRVSANIQLAQDAKGLRLDPLNVQLDSSKLQGHIHLLDVQIPAVRSKLTIDQINVDDYMPPAKEKTANVESGEQTASRPRKVQGNPFAGIVALDAVFEMQVGNLVANKAKMQDVLVKVTSKKGVVTVAPFQANLYDGKFDGSITLDARDKQPKVRAIKKLTNIQIGPLLQDVAGQDRLLGRGNVNVDMRVTGLSEPEIRRSLNGTFDFRLLDGAVKGVNIAKVVRDASGALSGNRSSGAGDEPNQTDFAEMSGSATVTNGVVSNQDLQAKSPLLRIDGKGTVDLPKDNIDYRLVAELVGSLEGQGGKGRDQLSGVPIPVKITGSLASPKYTPDLEGLLNAKAKQKLEEKKEELKKKAEEKIQDKLGEKAGELLKGLFGK